MALMHQPRQFHDHHWLYMTHYKSIRLKQQQIWDRQLLQFENLEWAHCSWILTFCIGFHCFQFCQLSASIGQIFDSCLTHHTLNVVRGWLNRLGVRCDCIFYVGHPQRDTEAVRSGHCPFPLQCPFWQFCRQQGLHAEELRQKMGFVHDPSTVDSLWISSDRLKVGPFHSHKANPLPPQTLFLRKFFQRMSSFVYIVTIIHNTLFNHR